MAELTIEQLIKIILGIFVVAAVVIGLYFFFRSSIIDFFKGLSPGNVSKFFAAILI